MRTTLSRRALALVVTFATLTAISVAWVSAGSGDERHRPSGSERPGSEPSAPNSAVAQTPLDFASDAVLALHGYDTRTPRAPWRRGLLSALGTTEASLGAFDVDRLIPDAAQWVQMAALGQRASATVDSVYVPALWEQTAREHSDLPDGAIGVTVTGSQLVSWAGGTSRVPVAVTVLLLCPPATERCALSRITAQVAR